MALAKGADKPLTTTDVYINRQDYRAHTDTVIYGAQGTAVNAHQAVGNIHTTSPNGTVVDKNTSHHYQVAIPHMDGPTQQQFKDNKDFLLDKLRPAPAPVAINPTPSQMPGKGESNVPTAVEKPRPATGHNQENGPQDGSSNLEPWQASVVPGFDAGLGMNGNASASSDPGDPLAQEVTFIYEHSQAASSSYEAPKTKTSHQGKTEDTLAYVYSAPKSVDEQARDYFQEQMVGFYGDYQSDDRREENKLDLTVPQHPPKNRAAHYQNTVSQPKDWQSSLARWERAVVDDFDSGIERPSPLLGNKLETNKGLTPIPIYQLPELRREPIKNSPTTDLISKTKQGINHLVDDILEINAGVQRGAIAGFTFNPMDTSALNSLEKSGYYVGEAVGVIGGLMIGEAVGIGKATGELISRFGLLRKVESVEEKLLPNFASQSLLEDHFLKHKDRFKGIFTSPEEYLAGAHDVIKNGIKVSYIYNHQPTIGFVKFAGTSQGKPVICGIKHPGVAKFEFVGTNNEGKITTYHIRSGKDFWRRINGKARDQEIRPFYSIDLDAILDFNVKF